jgi:hypothetical protein
VRAHDLSPTEAIGAAASRLAGHVGAIRDAHDDHGIPAGPHDDLTSSEYAAAAGDIYRQTLSNDYLHRTGLTFGAVTVLMDLVRDRQPATVGHKRWAMVRDYFAAAAEVFAPGYRTSLDDLPSLVLATQPTPPVVRFDLLAQLASRAAVLRMFDAASWVVEAVDTLPLMHDNELDAVALAALTASRTTSASDTL